MTDAFNTLLAAWQDWDLNPRSKPHTTAMVDAVTVFADELAMPTPHLRALMSKLRRDGLSHQVALEKIRGGES